MWLQNFFSSKEQDGVLTSVVSTSNARSLLRNISTSCLLGAPDLPQAMFPSRPQALLLPQMQVNCACNRQALQYHMRSEIRVARKSGFLVLHQMRGRHFIDMKVLCRPSSPMAVQRWWCTVAQIISSFQTYVFWTQCTRRQELIFH